MKSEIIGADGHVEARPYEKGSEQRRIRTKKGTVTQKEFLEHIRSTRYAREVHSDGFLAIASPARECECGGCAVRSDGYVCPRCGEQVRE